MFTNFLARGIFSIHDIWKKIKKMVGNKIFFASKNQFFHARQPRERIFDIRSHWCRIFTITWQSFKWLPLLQFWELVSKNEILTTISCIYFMKIRVDSWFSGTELVLLYLHYIVISTIWFGAVAGIPIYIGRCMFLHMLGKTLDFLGDKLFVQ